jgi:hypothetical protein
MELTTSGMTHSWGRVSTPFLTQDGERDRVTEWIEQASSIVASVFMHTLHQLSPWKSLVNSRSDNDGSGNYGGLEGSKRGLQYSLERNFGELEFDWKERSVTIRSLGEDPLAPPLIAARVSMDQLSGKEGMSDLLKNPMNGRDQSHGASSQHDDDWVCLEYRGPVSQADELLGYTSAAIALIIIFVVIPIVIPFSVLRRLSNHKTTSRTYTFTPSSTDSVVSSSDSIPSMASSVVSVDDLLDYTSS